MRDYLSDNRTTLNKLRGYYRSLTERKIRLIQQTTENLLMSKTHSIEEYQQLTAIQTLLMEEMLRRV